MPIQLSVAARNARLDAIETTVGTAALLRIFTGSPPANCAAADSGTLIAELNLPSNWMADAASGAKAFAGTWQDLSCNNSGTVGHFRLYNTAGSTCHMQGTVTITGGGGDMTVDSVSFTSGQQFTVTSFTLTDGNA
jgi:hypothetical protein